MLIKKRFNQLKVLTLFEWQLLLSAYLLLPLTALSLKTFGFKRTQQIFTRSSLPLRKKNLSKQQMLSNASITARMVSVAAYHRLYRANCLKKSLVLRWLLQQQGISTDLRIGVKKDSSNLNAHAWIELDGQVLIDNDNSVQSFCTLL